MYKDVGGSVEVIQGLKCNVPPVGMVYDFIHDELIESKVYSRSPKKSEQYWQRQGLPEDYDNKRKEELRLQKTNPEYFDPELEFFRQDQWEKRLFGMWLMINGTPTYITGLHWFYLNWWSIDIGYPDYREPDRKFFYFLEYVTQDPNCLGMIEVTKRRFGKTYRAGVYAFDLPSRSKNKVSGIQSKTREDAKKVFSKALVAPFKKLPDFFRPVYDESKGITPTSELRFYKTTKKGSRSLEDLNKPELESEINFRASEIFAYDGSKLHRYIGDEVGKTIEVDVFERHLVNRFTSENDGLFIGKHLLTTTVEEMESGGAAFKKLWTDSDQGDRNANNRTRSGLYRFFCPAYETLYFDLFGMPDVDRAKEFFLNERNALKHDSRALSSYIRKNPFTIEEAFRVDGDKCLFDAMKLNIQLDKVQWMDNLFTTGDFIWRNGERDTEVLFVENPDGRFKVRILLDSEDANNVKSMGTNRIPLNNHKYVIGVDPFDHNTTEDTRRSNGAIYVLRKHDSLKPEDSFDFVVEYVHRPPTAAMFYEDVVLCCHYFGCEALIENNKIGITHYFNDRGYDNFLMRLPGSNNIGIAGTQKSHQQLAELFENYIHNHAERLYFEELVRELLEFDINNTTKFDAVMAAGYALIADTNKVQRTQSTPTEVSSFFKKRKIRI